MEPEQGSDHLPQDYWMVLTINKDTASAAYISVWPDISPAQAFVPRSVLLVESVEGIGYG